MDEDIMSPADMSNNMYEDPLSFQMSDSGEELSSEDMETFDSY